MSTGSITILGIDPGFADTGLMAMRFRSSGGVSAKLTKVITTKASLKKRRIAAVTDEDSRLEVIQREFSTHLGAVCPDVVAAERCPQLRNPGAQRKCAMAYGVIRALVRDKGIPWLIYEPGDIKERVTGSRTASKQQMVDALSAMFPTWAYWPKTKRVEHVADAGGAALCAERDPLVEALLRERSL